MDHQGSSPQRRPPGRGQPGRDEARAASRDRGLRHVRRLSDWTAAALIAATAITAGYFAHAGAGTSPRPAVSSAHSPVPGSHQPCVAVPVATSGGSGVTTATVPSTCAPGQNGPRPPVVYVYSHEDGAQ